MTFKPRSVNEVYNRLLPKRQQWIEDIDKYFKSQKGANVFLLSLGYSQLTADGIQFSVVSHNFLLKGTIYESKSLILFQTYEIAFSEKNYPNPELITIPSLDFTVSIDEQPAFIASGVIYDFNIEYSTKLLTYIYEYQDNKFKEVLQRHNQ